MPSPAYLIFDLDGTISDPAVGILRSINFALTSFSYPEVTASEISTYIGPPIDHTFRSLTRSASTEHILALVGKFRERYAEVGYAENSLYPGIVEALDLLCARGVRLGLCTAKRADLAEKVLHLFGVRGHFEFVCGGDVGITKSDQLSGLLTDRVVGASSFMIGDRAVDVVAAKRNALRSIGVLWGHGSRDELVGAGADQLLSNTAELQELADSLQGRPTRL
jgi:phosphoglycolate phosphatase